MEKSYKVYKDTASSEDVDQFIAMSDGNYYIVFYHQEVDRPISEIRIINCGNQAPNMMSRFIDVDSSNCRAVIDAVRLMERLM